jgi:dihydroxyacid dehydratase/phosphogluconate dehydratase
MRSVFAQDDALAQRADLVGTCSVMGTASTMACVTEALGMMVPGGAAPPAVTADRIRVAEQTRHPRTVERA